MKENKEKRLETQGRQKVCLSGAKKEPAKEVNGQEEEMPGRQVENQEWRGFWEPSGRGVPGGRCNEWLE